MTEARRRLRRVLGRVPGLLALARLVVATIRICMRYRVTGLASEAGFFALLSLPPLVLGLVGGVGYVANVIGQVRVDAVIDVINSYASQFLTPEVINGTLLPTLDDVASGPRVDLLSLGLRALAVVGLARPQRLRRHHLDHVRPVGRARHRPHPGAVLHALPARARWSASSRSRWCCSGRACSARSCPPAGTGSIMLYWPLVTLLTVGGLTNLYHIEHPAPVAVAARRPGCRPHARDLDRGVVRRPRHDRRLARRGHVDLRPAVGSDRAAHLALHAGHRRADRGRVQRGHPRAVPGRGAAQPARAARGVGRGLQPAAAPSAASVRPAGTTRSTTTAPPTTPTTWACPACARPRGPADPDVRCGAVDAGGRRAGARAAPRARRRGARRVDADR